MFFFFTEKQKEKKENLSQDDSLELVLVGRL
jgi:hypothetical protein